MKKVPLKSTRLVIMVDADLRKSLDTCRSARSGVRLSEIVRRAIVAWLEKDK